MKWENVQKTVWDSLAQEKRPIVLYGMGDGAQKILNVFEKRGICASGVFASDEFVRGHEFCGFPVRTLKDTMENFGEDIVIVISFASQRPEVLEKMYALNSCYSVVAPDVPVAGEGLFDLDFAHSHKEQIYKTFSLMSDERSKEVLDNMLCFKLTGKLHYLKDGENDKEEIFNNILKPHKNEHFVDLGAYNGDTIRELLNYTDGNYASITALEPDKRNFKKLSKYAEMLQGDVSLINAGAWHKDDILTFAAKAGRNSRISKNGIQTEMRSVDSVLKGKPCTMMKFDVEGAEKEAIIGAKQTISQWKPRLNIACYHRNEDLFAIPIQLNEICPKYKFYLRHHPYVPAWDVNLYATI